MGVKPEESLYVGDHPLDVLCAKAARMKMAWITTEETILPSYINYKADYKIDKLTDLLVIL